MSETKATACSMKPFMIPLMIAGRKQIRIMMSGVLIVLLKTLGMCIFADYKKDCRRTVSGMQN